MDLLKKVTQRNIVAEPGEERLHTLLVSDIKQAPGTTKTVIAGGDGGSTQTRVTVIGTEEIDRFEELLSDVFAIPSASKTVSTTKVITAKGNALYDNLDSTIVNTKHDDTSIVKNVRLVRGTKAVDVEAKENRLKSTTLKTQDPTFYYNLLDDLGYAICEKYSNAVPEFVEVYLDAALPPDDNTPKNVEGFRNNLQEYRWTHNASGVTINFKFLKVRSMTEPEAAIKAFNVLTDRETPARSLHIEGGGRSIGVEILMDGVSLTTAQKTLPYGGKQMRDELNTLYVAKFGGGDLSQAVLETALRTGKVKDGNDYVDVMDLVDQVKSTFALKMVDDIIDRVFDTQTQVSIRDLNDISVSGRLFNITKRPVLKDDKDNVIEETVDQYTEGVGLAKHLAARFAELTPKTTFTHIAENYIPTGLVLNGLLEAMEEASKAMEEAAVTTAAVEEMVAEEAPAVSEEINKDNNIIN